MTQHTPGPWCLHLVDDTTIIDARGRFIASVCGGDDDLGEADYNNPDEWPVMEANARLIAAAPELLAELKLCEEILCEAFHFTPRTGLSKARADHVDARISAVRAAIAKAEGSR